MRLSLFIGFIGVCTIISLVRPYFGLLIFSWLAYMRPQNLAWAATSNFRFSYLIAIALIIGLFFNVEKEKFYIKARENVLLFILLFLFLISAIFSFFPTNSWIKLEEMTKIIFIAVITSSLTNSRQRFRQLAWVIAISFAFFSTKGALKGLFFGWRLQGPLNSMIADNNDFAMALNMVLPFFIYLGASETSKLKRYLAYVLFLLTAIAIIFTYSRGGFLGLCAVVIVLVLKSKRKLLGFTILAFVTVFFLTFIPADYKARIETIKNHQADESAMNRIRSWEAAWNMAKDRPFTGIGIGKDIFVLVFPFYHWGTPFVAHNSFLQLLAEAGFLALFIFLLLLFFTFRKLRGIRKIISKANENSWIYNYSHMLEVGLIGYIVSGMFLSRADFDLLYQFIGMAVALYTIALKETTILNVQKGKSMRRIKFPLKNRHIAFGGQTK